MEKMPMPEQEAENKKGKRKGAKQAEGPVVTEKGQVLTGEEAVEQQEDSLQNDSWREQE